MKWVLIVCGGLGTVIVAGMLWSSDLGGRVLAESVLDALERGDRDAFADLPRVGELSDDEAWERCVEAVSDVDMSGGALALRPQDSGAVSVEFGGGRQVLVPVERRDAEWAFRPALRVARVKGRVYAVDEKPDHAAAVAIVTALAERDREAFDALVADTFQGDAYDSAIARLGALDLRDARVVSSAGSPQHTIGTNVRTADGSTLRVTVQDVDGVWKLHGPIEVVELGEAR